MSTTQAAPPDAPTQSGGRRSLRATPPSFALLAAGACATLAVAGWLRRWTVDDAFIVFRVVDHVFAGNGPVFNAGERVEAVTSPLWLAVLSLARLVVPVPVEWLAVVIGLTLAVAGLAFAMAAAARLSPAGRGRLLPAGALLWLGLPPVWDFATSGLETGLWMAWLGGCCWALARLATRVTSAAHTGTPVAVAMLVGLGPVVRPDFGIFSVVFVIAVLLCVNTGRRGRFGVLAAAVAVPGIVELARMGYYAALLPNTLLAKEASLSNWSQGWRYLIDFVSPYWLLVPVAAVVWLVARLAHRERDRRRRIARLAPAIGAVLYCLAVVRGGGDFMHARLLLPVLFALLAPVAVIRARTAVDLVAVVVLGCWALVSAVTLRAPIIEGPGEGISDQRIFYVGRAGVANPVMLEDYRRYARVTRGRRAADLAASGRRTLIVDERSAPLSEEAVPTVVYEAGAVGLPGAAAGDQVYVLDRLGLGDPYAARQRLETRQRPGHDKPLPVAWVWGRYGVMEAVPASEADAARAAHTAMECAPLGKLRDAITQPLTARRFLRNIVAAPALTRLRYPSDPHEAVAELCAADTAWGGRT